LRLLPGVVIFVLLIGCGRGSGMVLPIEEASSAGERIETEEPAGVVGDASDTEAVRKPGSQGIQEANSGAGQSLDLREAHSTEYVTVHVCGAVRNPGVYEVEPGSRLSEAVRAAGGILEDGAGDYLNLAAVVSDGQKIVVPYLDEVDSPYGEYAYVQDVYGQNATGGNASGASGGESGQAAGSAAGLPPQGAGSMVNINTADAALLQTLPGIGASKAAAIIEYREKNGGFSSVVEIKNVPGIKDAAYGKIKDYITVQ